MNAVRLLWPEPLGCPSRPPASVCPSHLTFTVGNAPFVVETMKRRGQLYLAQLLCCALHLCSAPVHLSLLSQIIFATNWSFSTSCCTWSPLCKARIKWACSSSLVRSVHLCWLLWRELEGVGARPHGGPPSFGMRGLGTHSSCRETPLRPARWLWPGCSSLSP